MLYCEPIKASDAFYDTIRQTEQKHIKPAWEMNGLIIQSGLSFTYILVKNTIYISAYKKNNILYS